VKKSREGYRSFFTTKTAFTTGVLPNKCSVTGFGFSPGDGGNVFFPPKRKRTRSSHKAVSVGEQNGTPIAAFVFPGYFAHRRHFVGKNLTAKVDRLIRRVKRAVSIRHAR
jgi:hypothetical protein